jgi:hypothetical protein
MGKRTKTSFHAGVLLQIAREAIERAENTPPEALVSIVFSAVALECFIHDLADQCDTFQSFSGVRKLKSGRFACLLERAEKHNSAILLKLHLARLAFADEPFDEGAQPFQGVQLLFTIRDAIVHSKPDSLECTRSLTSAPDSP